MTSILTSLGISSTHALLSALLTFVVCLIAIKLLTQIFDRLMAHASLDGALKHFVRTAVRIALWALAIVIVAERLGIPTASLVAVISVAGLALSLSVQNIMTNLFAGITLLITKPFGAEDFVEVAGQSGTIRSVGLFYTVLATVDNRVISIPNSNITVAAIINYSREPLRRVDMSFCASYADSAEDVRAAILEAALADERVVRDPAPFVAVGQFNDSSVQYTVRLWCRNADYWDVYFGMNERIRDCFQNHGVQMPFNQLTVHLTQQ